MKKTFYLIVFLAVLLRFIGLSILPPALNRDEAAIGYNAYSILTTSRDEHGQFLPLSFKSIGDYKMPLYIYVSTIPIKFFGLNDFSIRFWSAFAGVISVIAVYYLVLKLTKKPKTALLASALMAFNPWAVFYSRIAFEANLALALFLTGLCLTLHGLKKLSWFYSGLIVLLLALLTYSSSLIFIPLFLIVFFYVFRRQLTKPHLLALGLFALFSGIIFYSLWTISAQKSNITIFSDSSTIDYYNHTRTRVYQQNPILARTWWNKYVFFTRKIAGNYLKSFSPQFLLLKGGGHPWHQIPQVGNFYYLEILLAVLGLVWLSKSKNTKLKILLFTWLILSPLPSAITIDAPHSTRSLYFLPVVLILAALGLSQLKLKKSLTNLLILIYIANLTYTGYQYLIVYPKEISQSLPVGLKEALQLVSAQNLDGQIYLTNIHDSIYLYPLVYTQFDPITFQSQAVWTKPDTAGLINAHQFGQFTIVDDLKDIKDPQAVILPQNQAYPGFLNFPSGNFNIYLIN